MHISIYDSKLTQLAFEMVGEEYEGEPREGISGVNYSKFCSDDDPNWPDCQCDIFLQLGDQQGYEECIEEVNTPPPLPAMSECGCRVYNDHQRKPGGSVRVLDTQFADPQGVNNIRIIVLGAFWQLATTKTDEKGCWRINKKFHLSPIAVYAQFRSSRITVRGMKGLGRIWQYALAVQTNRFVGGPNYRNICIEIFQNTDETSKEMKVWYAAHANNTVYNYDIYAQQDGIQAPPKDLQVLLVNVDESASAPMLHQMQKNPGVKLGYGGLVIGSFTASSLANLITHWIPVFGDIQPTPGVTAAFSAYILAFAPDVFYGYGNENLDSDEINSTFFHEYGHTAHYKGLSNKDYYWSKEIQYIIVNGSYGDGTATGAERAGIIESWGQFIEHVYVDRKYGLNHSLSTPPIEVNRHIYEEETEIPFDPLEDISQRWIAWGLFFDCNDDMTPQTLGITEPAAVVDNVEGFSISAIFQAMITGNPKNPQTYNDVEQNLINNLPAGQNSVDVTNLFQSYGY